MVVLTVNRSEEYKASHFGRSEPKGGTQQQANAEPTELTNG
jgi:hypothetical protein